MDKKYLKKLIKKEIGEYLMGAGFSRHKESVYIKIRESIIYNISFSFGSIGFTCTVAMQPLYVNGFQDKAFLHITFGSRLSRFKIVQKEWWTYDEPEKGVSEIKELLIKNGLPWFKQYGTPEGIIEFIQNGKVEEYGLKFNTYQQKQYLGFSLLYTGSIEDGISALEVMLDGIKEDAVDWIKDYKMRIIELICRVEKDPVSAKIILDDIVQENRIALKL